MSEDEHKIVKRCDHKGCEAKHESDYSVHPVGWAHVLVVRDGGFHNERQQKRDYCPEHAKEVAVFEPDPEDVAKLRAFREAFVEAFGEHMTPAGLKASLDNYSAREEQETREVIARQESAFAEMVSALRDVASALKLRGGAL